MVPETNSIGYTPLNYNSYHHKTVIKNIVSNMTSRIINTSKNNLEQEDIKTLINILQRSDYPKKEIQHIIKDTLSRNNNQQPSNKIKKETESLTYTLTLPYTPGIEILKRKLKKLKIKLMYSYPKKYKPKLIQANKPHRIQ